MDAAVCPTFRRIERLRDVEPTAWNALLERVAPGYPFLRHEFLSALEDSGAVGDGTGWQPAHVLGERNGDLVAAAPVYAKQHSFGEFVFDFAWADAYRRMGLAYYPKLVCAAPYSPVVGPRLLAADAPAHRALAAHLAGLPDADAVSSLHMLFAQADDRHAIADSGGLLRRDCQFHWHNHGYADFDAFLAQLSAKRRKEIRRERRRIHDAGIRVQVLAPDDIDEPMWQTLYAFYARTYHMHGQQPYLPPAFFRAIATSMPDSVRFFVAYGPDGPVGMAFMLVGADTLYGRHWGCAVDLDGLHFETCYYAGIAYCIEHGLARFDAGAQGEHKIRRGFEPVATYSAHCIREPRLHDAIGDFVEREGAMMADLHAEQRAHSAFPATPDAAP